MKMLKPRIATLNTSPVKMLTARIGATERTRGSQWMRTRARWFDDHQLCVMCEAKGLVRLANRLDHIVPLRDGGKDDDSNYQSLCASCHDDKTKAEAKARARGYA